MIGKGRILTVILSLRFCMHTAWKSEGSCAFMFNLLLTVGFFKRTNYQDQNPFLHTNVVLTITKTTKKDYPISSRSKVMCVKTD